MATLLQNLLLLFLSLVSRILADMPPPTFEVIVEALSSNGCVRFSRMLTQIDAIKDSFSSTMANGFTIFAPNDLEAFAAPKNLPVPESLPDTRNETAAAFLRIVEYYATNVYLSYFELMNNIKITTLASKGDGKFEELTTKKNLPYILLIPSNGPQPKIRSTILNRKPLVIYKIDKLLLPPNPGIVETPPSSSSVPGPVIALSPPPPATMPNPPPSSPSMPGPVIALPPPPPATMPNPPPSSPSVPEPVITLPPPPATMPSPGIVETPPPSPSVPEPVIALPPPPATMPSPGIVETPPSPSVPEPVIAMPPPPATMPNPTPNVVKGQGSKNNITTFSWFMFMVIAVSFFFMT